MFMHMYTSVFGPVKCMTEPAPDSRFAAVVVLTSSVDTSKNLLRQICPGTDALEVDALARAYAWALSHYPRPSDVAA
jgi:hypothetical protein